MTIPALLVTWIYAHIPAFNAALIIIICDILIALPVALIAIADTILYKFWQYKIEASVLQYLRSLKGAFASVSATFIVVGFSVVGVVAALFVTCLSVSGTRHRSSSASLVGTHCYCYRGYINRSLDVCCNPWTAHTP